MPVRLDKFLKDQGLASRSELKELIRKGSVRVNEKVVTDPGTHVVPEEDRISINGKAIMYILKLFF